MARSSPSSVRRAIISSEVLRIADATTGAVRDVLEEKVADVLRVAATAASTGATCRSPAKFIWFSERDNWGHLYLYDSETGKLKNQITNGEWNVTQLLRVDEKNRACSTSSAWAARRARPVFHPLLSHRVRRQEISRCSRRRTRITTCRSSTGGKYFVDSYSKPDVPAGRRAARRYRQADGDARDGRTSRKLAAAGWKPPHAVHREGARRRHRISTA